MDKASPKTHTHPGLWLLLLSNIYQSKTLVYHSIEFCPIILRSFSLPKLVLSKPKMMKPGINAMAPFPNQLVFHTLSRTTWFNCEPRMSVKVSVRGFRLKKLCFDLLKASLVFPGRVMGSAFPFVQLDDETRHRIATEVLVIVIAYYPPAKPFIHHPHPFHSTMHFLFWVRRPGWNCSTVKRVSNCHWNCHRTVILGFLTLVLPPFVAHSHSICSMRRKEERFAPI